MFSSSELERRGHERRGNGFIKSTEAVTKCKNSKLPQRITLLLLLLG